MLRARTFDTIVYGGFTAGVLDIGYAIGMSLARGFPDPPRACQPRRLQSNAVQQA